MINQVMMEWEKPYMEACIDKSKTQMDDVLEIGFGLVHILQIKIQSYENLKDHHTIVECSSNCDGEKLDRMVRKT